MRGSGLAKHAVQTAPSLCQLAVRGGLCPPPAGQRAHRYLGRVDRKLLAQERLRLQAEGARGEGEHDDRRAREGVVDAAVDFDPVVLPRDALCYPLFQSSEEAHLREGRHLPKRGQRVGKLVSFFQSQESTL